MHLPAPEKSSSLKWERIEVGEASKALFYLLFKVVLLYKCACFSGMFTWILQ